MSLDTASQSDPIAAAYRHPADDVVGALETGAPPVSVHAVYPTRKFLPEKVHVFLEALRAWRSPFWVSA